MYMYQDVEQSRIQMGTGTEYRIPTENYWLGLPQETIGLLSTYIEKKKKTSDLFLFDPDPSQGRCRTLSS